MYFVVDLKNKLLSYQVARFEEKISDAKVEVFNSDMDALVLIRDIIIHFYFYIFGKHYNIDETDIHINIICKRSDIILKQEKFIQEH